MNWGKTAIQFPVLTEIVIQMKIYESVLQVEKIKNKSDPNSLY